MYNILRKFAVSMAHVNDIDFEIKFYEGVLAQKPDYIEALGLLGDLYTKKGFYEKGLAVDEKLAQLQPKDPIVFYNLACSYSLLNHIDKSFASIQRSIECGYDSLDYLEKDPDLANLRNDERFKRYFLKVKGELSF